MKKLDDASIGNELPGLRFKYCDTPPKFCLFFPPVMCVVRKNPKTMLLLLLLLLHGVFDKTWTVGRLGGVAVPREYTHGANGPFSPQHFWGLSENERGELVSWPVSMAISGTGYTVPCSGVCVPEDATSLSPPSPFFSSYLLLYFRTSKTFNTSLSFFFLLCLPLGFLF